MKKDMDLKVSWGLEESQRLLDAGSPTPKHAAQPRLGPGLGWRHALVALIFVRVMVCFADRTNIGIVLEQADHDSFAYHKRGDIQSAFYGGYFFTQLLGAYLARRFGSKPTLLFAATIWTAVDLCIPFGLRAGVGWLIALRVLLGLGEGMLFPALASFSSFWVPTEERAFLITFMTAGQDVGAVVGNVITPRLLGGGVSLVYFFWGGLSLLWCIAYAAVGASAPEVHKLCRKTQEAFWIRQHRGAPDFSTRVKSESVLPWRLLRKPCVWAIVAGHIGVNYNWYMILSWMPSLFRGKYNIDFRSHPFLVAFPYVFSFMGSVFGGFASDRLVARGVRTRHVRKLMQVSGALLSALFLQLAAFSSSATWGTVFFALAASTGKLQNSGFWVNMQDVCPETAATVMGVSNTLATIPGVIGQPVTQWILDGTGGEGSSAAWSSTFGVGSAVACAGGLIFLALADDVNLDRDIHSL